MEGNIQEDAALLEEPLIKKPLGFKFKMELLMFTVFLAKTLSDTVIVNLLERNTCLVVLDFDDANCTEPVSPDLEGLVQENMVVVAMIRTMIEAFVPSLLSLFIGPWSDTNGRRPLMLLSLAGYTCSACMWCGLSLVPELHPMYFICTSIPVALAGGYVSFFLAIYCYISDITETDKRAFRMGLLEGACLCGVVVSSLVTPSLQKTSTHYGYTIVFATSAFLMLLTLLFTYFNVQESVTIVDSERTKLLRFDHVKNVFSTCFRSRPNYLNVVIMFIIINLVISIIIFDGELTVLYMFTQKKFGWTLEQYTKLTSFTLLIAGASLCSIWFFNTVLKLSDMLLIFTGTVCCLVKSVMLAMASSGVILYVANGFSTVVVLINPLSRSMLSKLVPIDDLGKIFAFSSFLEATAPLAASPLYTFVYKATLDTLPNAIFWLSAGLCCLSIILVGSAFFLQRLALQSTQQFTPVPDSNDSRLTSDHE